MPRIPTLATQSLAACILWVALTVALPATVHAQSLTSGSLKAVVLDESGTPVRGALVTLERAGVAFRTVEADRAGRATFDPLPPGSYDLLAEQLGFRPVRVSAVQVLPGSATELTIRISRQPPPISTVEVQVPQVTYRGAGSGRVLAGDALTRFGRELAISDASRHLTIVDVPRDGRSGMVASANGLGARYSTLFVDGTEQTLLRHPGRPGDPASTPLFAREGITALSASAFGRDGEWRGTPGAVIAAQSARGGSQFAFSPWATYSGATLGGRAADNPADSSASSMQVGATVSGPLKGDTAGYFLTFNYQKLATPSASPFAHGVDGSAFSAAAGARANEIARWLSPTVRTWDGFSGQGRIDYQLGRRTEVALRGGLANWSEDNPIPGIEATNGAGDRLDARDFSLSAAMTTYGNDWMSESRVGLRNSSRDWTGTGMPLSTALLTGSTIGSPFTGAGKFDESAFELVQSVTYRSGNHTIKGGFSAQRRTATYGWVPGTFGRYLFGTLSATGGGTGSYQQAVGGGSPRDIGVTEAGGFIQDSWQLSAALELFAGVRLESQRLPRNLLTANTAWGLASGFASNLVPLEAKGDRFAPRGGFTWDVGTAGKTTVRGSVGLIPGRYDLSALAEAAQYDGSVVVHRAEGVLGWPAPGTLNGATVVGPSLTFFGAEVRKPRSFEGEFTLTQRLGVGTRLTVAAGYRHGDYLLRRDDLNRPAAPLSTAPDGRPVWGALAQYGSLVVPTIGSNRRFAGIDAAYALTSSGYSDSYDATIAVDRQVTSGLGLAVAYTWSQTEDNLVGQLSGDPADRVSPFAPGSGWDVATSDLDIPHRLAATMTLRPAPESPLTLAARFRFRSGLPFTPGYRYGVDINGDGSGGNDPVAITGAPSGLAALLARAGCATGSGGTAARNSCREDAVSSLDLSAAIAIGGGRRLAITLDAFNVVATATGIVDRAALLVDPAGALSTNAAGRTVIPVMLNDNFGTLLSRRGEPRTLRIGLRVEN